MSASSFGIEGSEEKKSLWYPQGGPSFPVKTAAPPFGESRKQSLRACLLTVEARRLEHDRPPIPNQRKKEDQNKSPYIHGPTFGVHCSMSLEAASQAGERRKTGEGRTCRVSQHLGSADCRLWPAIKTVCKYGSTYVYIYTCIYFYTHIYLHRYTCNLLVYCYFIYTSI